MIAWYVITLPNTDRGREAALFWNKTGFPISYWRGVDAAKWGLETIHRHPAGGLVVSGQVGCSLSHWCLWNHLLHINADEAVILEDDAVPRFETDDLLRRIEAVKAEAPPDWQLIYLGYGPHEKPTATGKWQGRSKWIHHTHAYLVRRSALETMIRAVEPCDHHVDVMLIWRAQPLLQTFVVLDPLFNQRSSRGEWLSQAGPATA